MSNVWSADGEREPIRLIRGTGSEDQGLAVDNADEATANFGRRPLSPEEVAGNYIRRHGSYSDPDWEPRWRRKRMAVGGAAVLGFVVAVVAVVAFTSLGKRIEADVRGTPAHTGTPIKPPLIKAIQDIPKSEVTFNVHLSSFRVQIVAFGGPTSVQMGNDVYNLAQSTDKDFIITGNSTFVTANSSARIGVYEGSKFIGFFFPQTGPFTFHFHALGPG
jgi:hypothetical protein